MRKPTRPIPVKAPRPVRAASPDVPPTPQQRDALWAVVARYVAENRPVPPLSLAELRTHVDRVRQLSGLDRAYDGFAAVLLNNEAWRDSLAAVPYNRRLLLLPQCLRDKERCKAATDEMGLLCASCGSCLICDLKARAEQLGYVVLIAEGVPVVMSLVRSGQIQGIVGVSCLAALRRIYPYIEAAALPAAAIPLIQDGCADTSLDEHRLWDVLLDVRDGQRLGDMEQLYHQVEQWFSPSALAELLGPPQGGSEQIAQSWLAGEGKRWRPFLAACTYAALTGSCDSLPADIRRCAVAVECFHKASLVHDDIEDGDDTRYGRQTLHRLHGVPVALNVGDLLIGEGYRLIAQCSGTTSLQAQLLRVAAEGHRDLCLGQGEELGWLRKPHPLGVEEVLGIFRRKTAPAFEVALLFGAACAGADPAVCQVLSRYSEYLGVAYQIHDDLADYRGSGDGGDLGALRPSVLLALAYESADAASRHRLEGAWGAKAPPAANIKKLDALVKGLGAEDKAAALLRHRLQQAVASLDPLKNVQLKRLLRQVLAKVFKDEAICEAIEEPDGNSKKRNE